MPFVIKVGGREVGKNEEEPGGENSSDGSNVGYLFSFWSSSWEVRREAAELWSDGSMSHHTKMNKDDVSQRFNLLSHNKPSTFDPLLCMSFGL